MKRKTNRDGMAQTLAAMGEKKGNGRMMPLSDTVFSCVFNGIEAAEPLKGLVNAIFRNVGDREVDRIVGVTSQHTLIGEQAKGKLGRADACPI